MIGLGTIINTAAIAASGLCGHLFGKIFPEEIASFLCDGIHDFGRKLAGFDMPDAVLTGVESRTSAPYRIARGELLTSREAENVYPAGEGAGWSGGIMSSAVDGIRVAEAIISRYSPDNGNK